MLYTLTLDKENFILSVSHTVNDDAELDLSALNLNYLNAYQYIDGNVVLNEARMQMLMKEEADRIKEDRIEELEMFLASTDYIMDKAVEDMLALNNPVTFISDFIKILADYSSKYKDVIAQRKNARAEIEQLEDNDSK